MLIDRDALIKALGIAEDCADCQYDNHGFCSMGSEFVNACEAIFDMPTIDPVKHGRWITTEYNDGSVLCECSYCGHARSRDGLPINYCPNCGARMEGEEDE